jgi:hypothetical protein
VSDELTPQPLGFDQVVPHRRRTAAFRVDAALWLRRFRQALYAGILLYAAAFAARAYVRQYFVFLPDYLFRWSVSGTAPLFASRPTHVFVLMTDHFEPDGDLDAVKDWARRYAALAGRHRDSAGRPPQHTWFYPAEQVWQPVMHVLGSMAAAGLGEVELHHHHGFDTAATLHDTLAYAISEFQENGFLQTVDGRTQFAYIHGNSGLDNSNGDWLCGVNTEIRLLRDLGCFADFTFPSLFEQSQPRRVNSIYATRDDERPKSYDFRLPLSSLRDGGADLMIFEGPLIFSPSLNPRRLFLDLDDGDIHAAEHASPARADRWIRANVHVAERPDWVFVKLFSHGISTPGDIDAVLGDDYDEMLSYVESEYNDGSRYVLHYVTAREAYNLARAAADGAAGDPQQYLDKYAPAYAANARGRHESRAPSDGSSPRARP